MSGTLTTAIPWEEHELDELRQLVERGEAAIPELLARYEHQLRRMIHVRMDKRLFGRVDPADVWQEVYLEVARRTHQYVAQPKVPLFVWLRQVTSQVLVNHYRQHIVAQRRDIRQEQSLASVGGSALTADSLAIGLAADWTSPSQAAIRAEANVELIAALEALSEMDREILTLRHFEGLSNNEVARILGIQKSAASNRYVRALERLQQAMRPRSTDSGEGR